MVVYLKDKDTQYVTLQDIAIKYNVSLQLVQGRYRTGIREIEELIKPKWAKWEREE